MWFPNFLNIEKIHNFENSADFSISEHQSFTPWFESAEDM